MKFLLNYPLLKAASWLEYISAHRKKVEMAHILCVGPIAFAIIWQEDRK